MKTDCVVLGAGIVGVSIALHLQARGRDVVLIDRRGPGEETSFGNAGLIERASLIPYPFPRQWRVLLRYALNIAPEAHYHLSALPSLIPFLWRYWQASSAKGLQEAARDMSPLIEACLIEHTALMQDASCMDLMRRSGWIKAFRSPARLASALEEAKALLPFGIRFDTLDTKTLQEREPTLSDRLIGAIHWRDPATVSDPGGVVRAFAQLFMKRGGIFLTGDARNLKQEGSLWRIEAQEKTILARDAVIALGPWSDEIFQPLGYRIPLVVKRGYHQHFSSEQNALLNHPVLDVESGFVLAPMVRGIRLTTGVEFARRDAPPSPVQIERTQKLAREIFPLGLPLDHNPWLGSRPCLPDMRPIIGPAPHHHGLWFAFGHNHHGFTLGPVTGKLLAQMMTGERPFTDPYPWRADRF
jgi:D-amino-acid dehydrogenase